MSFAEWSDNKHKKKKKEGQTFAEWSNEKYGVDDIAPIRTTTTLTGDDIAPPVTTKKSLFDDGYDFGDITKTILNSREAKAQKTSNVANVTVQEDKYSKFTLKQIDDEIERLQGEKKAYESKNGNKIVHMASSVADKILYGITDAMGVEVGDSPDKKSGLDAINDYQAEIEKLQTYRLKKATEEKYNVLDKETLSEIEILSGGIGEGHIEGILDMVGMELGETKEEKAARKSLKKKGYSDDDIAELIDLHNRVKQSEINRDYEDVMADFGSEHPVAQVGQSAFTDIYGSLGSNLSKAKQYIDELQGRGSKYGINTDDIYHGITKGNVAADTQAKADHNWKVELPTGQEVDAFDIVFDVGSGVADNLARMAVVGGNSTGSGAVMGSQVFNQSVIEGKEKGYSDEKALTIGLLQATIESLTEKYSVETILGDSGSIGRKLVKSFVAEGSEGVTSDWLNRVLDVIANGNHSETMKAYNSYIADGYSEKDALVQMIYEIGGESLKTFLLEGTTGLVLGGGVEIVNTAQQKTSTKSEKNTVNKLVEEQVTKKAREKAIEKSVNEEIARREKEQGGKLTEENKKALRESHIAKIESGEIELSSEELSKQDIADIKKEIKDSLKNGKIELSKIEDLLTPDATKEINELKDSLENTKDEQKKAEIEGKIRQLESVRAENLKSQARENKYLQKAVYEKIASDTRYEDDSEITNENEKALVESAKRYANNTTETRKYIGVLRKMVRDGKRIVITNNQALLEQGDLVARDDITAEIQAEIKNLEKQLAKATDKKAKAEIQDQIIALKYLDVGGMVRVDENGVETIIINVDSTQAKYTVLGHEAKHTLEKYGLNEKFNEILFEYAKTKGDLDTVRERIESLYKNRENVDIDGEVAAELTGKYLFEDEKFLETLMKNKSDSKVQQVINKIKELIDDLVIRFKGTEQEKQLREVQKKFTELYNSTEADIVNETTEGTQYAIDNNQNLVYNDSRGERYVRTDEFRNLQAESQRMSYEDTQAYWSGSRKIDDEVRGRLSRAFGLELRPTNSKRVLSVRTLLNPKTNNTVNIVEGVDASLFHDVFEISRKYLRNGELVDLHDVETTEDHGIGYKYCDNYLSEDGLSGFSITPDGDLISVFNLNTERGFLKTIAPIVKEKAKTLDCYASPNQNLMVMYEKIFGFKTASIMDYNMEFDHDNIAKNHEEPKVAFMVNTENDVEVKNFTKEKYDEAVEYRNSFINQAVSDESAFFDGEKSESADYVETNSKAVMTNERIDYLIEDSGAGSRQDYANYWITSISPTDFINLTTTEKTQDRDFFDSWGSEWNPESNMSTYDYMGELKKNMRQTPYLAIDINTGEVVGHEGRHRMRALEQNGITSAEIRVEFRDGDGRIIKYSPDGKRLQIKDAMQIINQFGTKQSATIKNIIPLNKDYRNEILANYGETTAQENDVRYSLARQSENVDYNKSLRSIRYDDFVPIRSDIAPMQKIATETTSTNVLDGDLPIRDDIAPVKPPKKAKKGETGQPIAKILTKEPEVKKKHQLWSKIKTNFIDKASPFETLALKTGNREVDAKFNSIRYSDTKAQLLIGEGADGVKALNDIQAEVENSGLTEALYDYLYHKHNVDRMTLENRYEDIPNKAVFGDSMTAELSQKIVDKYEFENPKLIEYANDVYTYNKHLRNLLVEGGVISQETADLWEEMYPHYVPVRRVDSAGLNINVPLDSGRTGINAPIKRAKGGNTDILPLFDTMAQRTLQTYKAVAKNRFGIELKNTLGTTVAKSETSVDEVIDSIDTQDDLLKEGKYGKNPTFTVFENGEKVTFEITDEMYDAMKPTSEGLAYTNKVANTISNSMRGVLTEYNPTFMLTNAIKDAQDVLINSQHPVKTYKNFPKAVKELASKGKWYTEYIQNGGADNTYFDKQTNTFNKEKSGLSKAIGFPLEKISMANNFIERIPRLAEYIASRESGRSVDVSMLDSARVTTNFSAGGDVTKFLNRNGATFLNASVQGAAQQVRNVREAKANGLKGWVQLATKVALAGLPALFLNGLLWDDDEEYEELSDYVKQNYYVVAKMQDGKFVRIPKGRTMAVIQEAFTQVQNALTGDDEVDLQSFLDLAISNLAPNNPLDNNIIAPIMQVKNNETWYGEDLVPTRLQDVPDAEQYDESTDAISKWLGEKLNYSPYKINYLLNQYSGGLGDVFLPMLTPEAESGDNSLLGNFTAPMKDKFSTDSVFNNQNTTDFYNVSDELMINANSINATDEDVLKNKYFNSVSTEIGELYKEKREIQNSDLSDDLKFKQVRDIQKQINEITENALNTYKNVTINGSYANIGDRHYRLNDDGEWQKITDEQLEKQNEVIGILGITPAQYWGNKAEYDMKAFYPEKYAVLQEQGISVAEYKEKYEESVFMYTDDFSWASKNPEKYTLSKAVTDDVMKYKQYTTDLYNIKADKDSNGNSISGSRKKKVLDYINNLDIDYGAKCILLKKEYSSEDRYNKVIVDYLIGRDDITTEEKKTILEELGATVDSNGYIHW